MKINKINFIIKESCDFIAFFMVEIIISLLKHIIMFRHIIIRKIVKSYSQAAYESGDIQESKNRKVTVKEIVYKHIDKSNIQLKKEFDQTNMKEIIKLRSIYQERSSVFLNVFLTIIAILISF